MYSAQLDPDARGYCPAAKQCVGSTATITSAFRGRNSYKICWITCDDCHQSVCGQECLSHHREHHCETTAPAAKRPCLQPNAGMYAAQPLALLLSRQTPAIAAPARARAVTYARFPPVAVFTARAGSSSTPGTLVPAVHAASVGPPVRAATSGLHGFAVQPQVRTIIYGIHGILRSTLMSGRTIPCGLLQLLHCLRA